MLVDVRSGVPVGRVVVEQARGIDPDAPAPEDPQEGDSRRRRSARKRGGRVGDEQGERGNHVHQEPRPIAPASPPAVEARHGGEMQGDPCQRQENGRTGPRAHGANREGENAEERGGVHEEPAGRTQKKAEEADREARSVPHARRVVPDVPGNPAVVVCRVQQAHRHENHRRAHEQGGHVARASERHESPDQCSGQRRGGASHPGTREQRSDGEGAPCAARFHRETEGAEDENHGQVVAPERQGERARDGGRHHQGESQPPLVACVRARQTTKERDEEKENRDERERGKRFLKGEVVRVAARVEAEGASRRHERHGGQ